MKLIGPPGTLSTLKLILYPCTLQGLLPQIGICGFMMLIMVEYRTRLMFDQNFYNLSCWSLPTALWVFLATPWEEKYAKLRASQCELTLNCLTKECCLMVSLT